MSIGNSKKRISLKFMATRYLNFIVIEIQNIYVISDVRSTFRKKFKSLTNLVTRYNFNVYRVDIRWQLIYSKFIYNSLELTLLYKLLLHFNKIYIESNLQKKRME